MHCKRTKLGQVMYNITLKLSKPIVKHRWLYYALNFTWGIVGTLIGILITTIMLLICREPYKCKNAWYFKVGSLWGGMSIGTIFVRDSDSYESINGHEYGHTIQNAIFGPFMLVLVYIPSAIRYWYFTIRVKMNKPVSNYDDAWFEGSATDIGNL